ncbi:11812_t:CDS:2 [Acaulospora morrowiae]|uniref:11812_t:CDS:1 n=1 Tax=Acaulospora morrowiae TaxID=94023 RepID=A0A9N9CIH7_9GLOM|nr:11812_t:CDS:2 [Acaulospora morrowiae]
MVSTLHADLINDIGSLLQSGQNYDVVIYAGEEPNTKEYLAHSLILCARSSYFQAALLNNWERKNGGVTVFKKPNISANIFGILLRYLYTATIDLDHLSAIEVLKLWAAADDLDLQKFSDFIRSHLDDKKIDYLRQDPVQFIRTIDNVHEWGVEDFTILRKTLHPFIPLVRWFQIPASDFWRKVRPFEKILPKELYISIIGHHLDPSSQPHHNSDVLPPRFHAVDSVIIDQKHFDIITGWIDDKTIGSECKNKSSPYYFRCLFRASRDGFGAPNFHKLCNEQGPTIMISKVRETGQIIGGHNPLNWQEGSYQYDTWLETKKSFLFSFKNKQNVESAVIARVTNPQYAIGFSPQRGPSFGDGWDLTIESDGSLYSHSNNSYSDITKFINNATRMSLEDYEVFQIVLKNPKEK